MKKLWALLSAVLMLLLLCGCEQTPVEETVQTTQVTEETIPPTIPADGNPGDVTCKGSYTAQERSNAVAAELDGAELTNGQLQVFYWAEVEQYRQEGHERNPDYDKPLDTQTCDIDSSVNSWQQYFLKLALNTWHSAQALQLQGLAEGVAVEEAYQPNLSNYAKYLTDKPAMVYHYSYNLETYHPNTLHQAFLDELPAMLEELAAQKDYADVEALAREAFGTTAEALESAAEVYNFGYMYFTELSYSLEVTQEQIDAYMAEQGSGETGRTVDIRHILLVPDDLEAADDRLDWQKKDEEPVIVEYVQVAEDGKVSCSEEAWEACRVQAEALLAEWEYDYKHSETSYAHLTKWGDHDMYQEAIFSEKARYNSEDPGTAINGGSYSGIRQGQLLDVLDEWCFDESRQWGDTAIVRSEYGYHILFFAGSRALSESQAEQAVTARKQAELAAAAREQYPMTVHYSAISLTEARPGVTYSDLLYPDIAHQRYPEVPLYLQQDYPQTMYGAYEIRTNGCGITTMAMLATYMTDEPMTPPLMCQRYGHYSYSNGTDGRIFLLEPSVMGFFCREKTYNPLEAKEALAEGKIVVSLQHKGYWTGGGHYILLEKLNENDTVQVRDSNIFNYHDLRGHLVDAFDWPLIPQSGSAFWIFEEKVTAIPACSRCGDPEGVVESLLEEAYTCEKCEKALLRRNTYLAASTGG